MQWIIGINLWVLYVAVFWLWWKNRRLERLVKAYEKLIIEHNERRIKLYEELADPEKIEADMEKSARMREMRDAHRSTLPREGAWPPAKVYRPQLRGQKPGNWRIQRP